MICELYQLLWIRFLSKLVLKPNLPIRPSTNQSNQSNQSIFPSMSCNQSIQLTVAMKNIHSSFDSINIYSRTREIAAVCAAEQVQ